MKRLNAYFFVYLKGGDNVTHGDENCIFKQCRQHDRGGEHVFWANGRIGATSAQPAVS
jgi:hypothetical protein